MSGTFIIGFDGTPSSQRAVDLAAGMAQASGARLHLVHVLEWSPYTFLTKEEVAERHKRREEELKRAEEFILPHVKQLQDSGLTVTSEVRYGHAGEIIVEIAEKSGPDTKIFIGRKGKKSLADRLLGGLAMTVIQASPVPVTVVP